MKRKFLISIIALALFAVAIGLSLNNNQEDNLKVKNIAALAAGGMGDETMPDGSIPCSWACTPDAGTWCVLCGGTCHAEPNWSSGQHGWCVRP